MAARANGERLAEILEELLVELPTRLRGTRGRLSETAMGAVRGLVDELGLVTRDDLDELELRVAQLEHRLRLLEQPPAAPHDVGAERRER